MPRLLLVSPGSRPPVCMSCLEDWARLPVADEELRARLDALAEHQRAHTHPSVDEFGVLRQNGSIVFLSPREQALAEILIANFGAVVRDEVFSRQVFRGADARPETLRTYTSRLRKRIAPLGLTISCIRNVGYMMHHDNVDDAGGA
jgi:two-component system, OmpR family, response regulator